MKKLFKISVLVIMAMFMVNCTNDDKKDNTNIGGGAVPTAGWRIGTTNYTTAFTMKNVQPNTVAAFDRIPALEDVNSVIVLFNNITGVAAGTFKVVDKQNQENLLADEIIVTTATGYSQATGKYLKDYATELGKTVNATVTITGGKVKIVIPEIAIFSYPLNASSTKTTFAGTIIEK